MSGDWTTREWGTCQFPEEAAAVAILWYSWGVRCTRSLWALLYLISFWPVSGPRTLWQIIASLRSAVLAAPFLLHSRHTMAATRAQACSPRGRCLNASTDCDVQSVRPGHAVERTTGLSSSCWGCTVEAAPEELDLFLLRHAEKFATTGAHGYSTFGAHCEFTWYFSGSTFALGRSRSALFLGFRLRQVTGLFSGLR